MIEGEGKIKIIKPFGPSVAQIQIPETLIKELNDYVDRIIKDEKKTCLISGLDLDNEHIKLNCGHTFNYLPIFNEIKKQKQNKSLFETQKLEHKQIKCPYCRRIKSFSSRLYF